MLRVIRFRVRADESAAFDAFTHEVAIPRVADGGALGVVVGRRAHGDEVAYAVASRYRGYEAMRRLIGDDLSHAQFLEDWREHLIDPQAEHFEAMDLEPEPSGQGEPGLLRIFTGRVNEADASAYYDFIRRDAWPAIRARPGLVSALFGRRLDEGVHSIAFVTAWAATQGPPGDEAGPAPLRSSPLIHDIGVEIYAVVGSLVR